VPRLPFLLSLLAFAAFGAACGAAANAGGSSARPSTAPPAPHSRRTSTAAAAVRPPLAGARAVVASYVAAYSRHDPAAVCTLESAALRRYEGEVVRRLYTAMSCEQLTDLVFHPLQDNPPPVFRRATVARWEGSGYDGTLAAVRAAIHVEFPNDVKPLNDPQTATFFLTDDHGSWRILDDGGLSKIVSGGETPITAGMTPLRRRDVASSLSIADAGFPCAGAASVSTDPTNDVHDLLRVTDTSTGPAIHAPWLDIRRVAVYGTPTGRPCVEVTFAQPLRAGTTLEVIFGGTTAAELAFGKAPQTAWTGLAPGRRPFGEHGSTVRFLLAPSDVPTWRSGHLAICAVQPLYDQPLLDDLRGPQDIWGYHATRPLADCP
jgi:hypothetical protein